MREPTFKAEIFDQVQRLFDLNGLNDHQLHCVLRFESGSAPDAGLLRKALVATIGAFPVLGSRYVAAAQPFWESLEPGDYESAFETAASSEALEAFLVRRADEERSPQIRLCWLNTDPPAAAITLNHMVADGAGFKACLYFLCETYSRLARDPAYVPPRNGGDRGFSQVVRRFSLASRINSLLTEGGDNRAGDRTFPMESGGEDAPFIATRRIAREKAIAVRNHARASGATLNDSLLTAFYRCLFRTLDVQPNGRLTIPIMVDMRRYLEPGVAVSPLSNLSSMAATSLERRPDEPFDATLARVKAMTEAKKRRAIGVNSVFKLDLLFRLCGDARANRLLRRGLEYPLICMTNIGVIDEERVSFAGSRPSDAFICGSIKYKPSFQLALSTWRDEITLSSNLYGGAIDRRRIEAFLADVEAELPADRAA
jgi:NRPS condensation-like uncharacterized protein